MITVQDVTRFENAVAALERPVVSLYLDVNTGGPAFNPKAASIRARETLRELDVPDRVARRVLTYLEGRGAPARTLAAFASAEELHVLPLQVALPVRNPSTGHVVARYGEPYLLPLELARDEFPHYGVVYIDRNHWRLFDAYLGDFQEVVGAFRTLHPENFWNREEARQVRPAYTPTRSDADKDNLDRAVADWTHRFHKRAGRLLEDHVDERGLERLVLMGPATQARDFCNALPRRLRDRVVSLQPSLSNPDASAGEVRSRFDQAVEGIEREQEAQLLDEIREKGLHGFDRCLAALQEGRLYVLALPWTLSEVVYRDAETGHVATTEAAARERSTDSEPTIEETNIRDVILELAQQSGCRLELVRHDNDQRLRDELGGMGGLTRW